MKAVESRSFSVAVPEAAMTKILLIGAGQAGTSLLEMFLQDPSITIVGVVDVKPEAPGLLLARRLRIPRGSDFKEFIRNPEIDLILDVTGNPEVDRMLWQLKAERAEVMGGRGAKFLWDLMEERRRKQELEGQYKLALRELRSLSDTEFIIGSTPSMREIGVLITKVAPTPTTVLIRGESGTGKEVVARAIHQHSRLRDKPLVTVNCTALSPTLMESELFGHRKGAFTGAIKDKIGLFEKAAGGTIFLDEIGDMSLEMQAKLLRVLQAGEIKPVGDVATRQVEVRVIAATNRDLEGAIQRGEVRSDLYYRFNTFTITLPPLRERAEDIPILAAHFLRKAEAKVNKKVERVSPEAIRCLKGYSWPGNLRELENTIERGVVLAPSGQIDVEHLPLHIQSAALKVDDADGFSRAKARMVDTFERDALSRYLSQANGNISQAATIARMTRRTFHRLILKYRISPRGFRAKSS
jgi:transcriptional regulator with GAF, ATPase, and Fis domain